MLGPLLGVCLLAVGACAGPIERPALPAAAELVAVPFFPQTEYHCGPAALATVLNAAAVPVTPAELIDAVYIEGLRGSLQAELIAATRRYGLLPVPIAADPALLLAEVASGRPVLVLQNLGLKRVPVWHYAVVIGFDPATDRFVLRSGREPRRLERADRFLRSWRLGDHWAFVAVPPGQVPTSVTAERYMRALVDAERGLELTSIATAYEAALRRWPQEPWVTFLVGVRAQKDGRLAAAAEHYRHTLAVDPAHAAARNNLAHVLLAQGCPTEALREARAALASTGPASDFYANVRDTVDTIERAAIERAASVCTP